MTEGASGGVGGGGNIHEIIEVLTNSWIDVCFKSRSNTTTQGLFSGPTVFFVNFVWQDEVIETCKYYVLAIALSTFPNY